MRAQNDNPDIGIRMLKGHLQSLGHRIQRARICSSLRRTDPTGVMQRWQKTIKRRQYQVRAPLSLWHIDGNHKLIRYVLYKILNNALFIFIRSFVRLFVHIFSLHFLIREI